jgi:hypothetical protein
MGKKKYNTDHTDLEEKVTDWKQAITMISGFPKINYKRWWPILKRLLGEEDAKKVQTACMRFVSYNKMKRNQELPRSKCM